MTDIKLKPTPGVLIIEPSTKNQDKTASGIYLPSEAQQKPQTGVILAIGDSEILPSGKLKPSPVKVGDEVIYKKYGGSEVNIDGQELLFAKFDDILAVQL